MTAIQRIEMFFNMNFDSVINELHWTGEVTLMELSKRCGVCRDSFQKECKKRGIKLRTPKEARALVSKQGTCSGYKHWAFGLRKETSLWAKQHSERMKSNNPCANPTTRRKMSLSLSEFFKTKPQKQELLAMSLLESLGISFKFQVPVGSYVIDFVLLESFCLEIDSTDKWGLERKKNALKKDAILKANGFTVVRINKRHLTLEFMHDILAANNII